MDTKELRIMAAYIIVDSDLSKVAKLQMIKFIKNEATDSQVKVLLMDGKIVQLDDQAEEIVNDRFSASEAGGRVATMRKTAMSRAGTAGIDIGPLWLLYRKIRSKYDVCTKRCGTYELNTARRQNCMLKCKVEKLAANVAASIKEKNETEIAKNKLALAKAKEALQKSIASFKQRGSQL